MLSFLFSQPGAPGAVSKEYGTAHAHSRPGGRLSSTTPATQDMVAPLKIQEPLIAHSRRFSDKRPTDSSTWVVLKHKQQTKHVLA